MKRWIYLIAILCLLFCVWLSILIGIIIPSQKKEEIKNLYPLSAIVEEISIANDTVTIRDYNGNLWQFKGVEDWAEGDICACIFDNKKTPEIKDDEIVSVRYSGAIEEW